MELTCLSAPLYQVMVEGGLEVARQESCMSWPRLPVLLPDIVT